MKMMKVMKVSELLLILSCVLCVPADNLHEYIRIAGCSDSGESNGEFMYGLDGEELYYSDFNNKRGVYPQPDFVDGINYGDQIFQFSQGELESCRWNLKLNLVNFKNLPLQLDPPSSPIVYLKDKVELGVQNTLICHVTGFYPAPVKLYWTKNGQNMTEGTSINVPYINTDGSYRQTSRLEFIPQQGDIYSCRVTHPATEPLTRIWDVEVQQPGVGPAVFCGLGLTVGLLGVAAGTFFLVKGNECS
ncbi:RLA class II histocompatibility antigen, DP alpha-1 chain-like [Thunnus maccoyii]|uniref:RLA class II histocompatibility antigen, DP alpha-1 chain-like n=1 Tax=Thunnus maccoyii TaxID=8240 RepID=UPI001C4D7A2E|nr:RLA class II histocompatibility antigen, DP alpha-1 chain-like [Thunnus maccoyii]